VDDLKPSATTEVDIAGLESKCYDAMNDDFNSPVLIAELFELSKIINSVHDGKTRVDEKNLELIKNIKQHFVFDVMGLKDEQAANDELPKVIDFIINLRSEAKNSMDYATSDKIRNGLQQIGFQLKDSKEGTTWSKV
jgi:cysteinyl-tRNA synthetase